MCSLVVPSLLARVEGGCDVTIICDMDSQAVKSCAVEGSRTMSMFKGRLVSGIQSHYGLN